PLIPAIVTAVLMPVLVFAPLSAAAAALAFAGLLNGCYEIQKTTLERPPPDGANLTGLVLGLVTGFALIFAIALPLLHECRKQPTFQQAWAPKIAAVLALGALVLAF
ncbi:MAG TPA: hypothetical protein VHY09_07765, partial [Candidatus Methylacidiphilales bacterium]|nr:hypothetical protein [Candidatus Methylacidiphilales bacterium]